MTVCPLPGFSTGALLSAAVVGLVLGIAVVCVLGPNSKGEW